MVKLSSFYEDFEAGGVVKWQQGVQFDSIGCSKMQHQLYWLLPVPISPANIITHPPLYLLAPPPPSHFPQPYQSHPPLQYQPHALHQNSPLPSNNIRQRRHFKRRSETQLNKCHKCPYPNCHKDYASDLALNLHMKNKHRGGNKKERDHAAKLILKSELEGKPAPKCDVELPPGYLQSNKIRLILETESEVEDFVKIE